MENTSFSIIVPVYNTKIEFLSECFCSIDNLNYENYEVVVVNDGSNDETSTFLSQLNNPKYRLITHKKNMGLPSSRITGIQNAKNEYIFFLDSDDLIDVNALYEINKIIDVTHSDVVMFSTPRFYKTTSSLQPFNHDFNEGIVTKENVMKELLSLHMNSICNKCAKKKLLTFDKTNIDTSIVMGEDLQQSTTLILNSNSFYYLEKPVYYYRINENDRGYYNYSNLNDMNYLIPCYKKVFIENTEYSSFITFFKQAAVNSIIYRTFKLCQLKNYKQLINNLNKLEITKILNSRKEKISFASQMIFNLITHNCYSLIFLLSLVFNRTHKDY